MDIVTYAIIVVNSALGLQISNVSNAISKKMMIKKIKATKGTNMKVDATKMVVHWALSKDKMMKNASNVHYIVYNAKAVVPVKFVNIPQYCIIQFAFSSALNRHSTTQQH